MTLYYLVTVVPFAVILFLNFILNTHIVAWLVTISAAAALIILIKKKILNWIRFSVLLVSLMLIAFLFTYFARADLSISFRGQVVNEGLKFITHSVNQISSQSLVALRLKYMNQEYDFNSWQPPAEYENNKIKLSESEAYLLQKKDITQKKIIYQLHGGAYITPFSEHYNEMALKYSKAYDQADVFSLDYRTAPEAKHPAALKDAVEGYNYLLKKGYQPEDIVIAGDSAGGGLALALTLKLRDEKVPLPKALVLASPWTDLAAEGKSYQIKIEADPFFGYAEAEKAPRYPVPITYAGNQNLKDPYLSPAYGDLSQLPPILIQTGSEEILLSDSKIIEEKAEAAGVEVEMIVYPGMYHTFYLFTPSIPESKAAWQKIEKFIN